MGDDDELMEELAATTMDEGLANTFDVFPASAAGLRSGRGVAPTRSWPCRQVFPASTARDP